MRVVANMSVVFAALGPLAAAVGALAVVGMGAALILKQPHEPEPPAVARRPVAPVEKPLEEPSMTEQAEGPREPSLVVLEGVPRVTYQWHEGRMELTPFPSCLRAWLEFVGDDLGRAGDLPPDAAGQIDRDFLYTFVMGTSGAAFRLVWNAGQWDAGNVDVMLMAVDPLEPFRRAFQAAGYECEIVGNVDRRNQPEGERDIFVRYEGREFLRGRIVESIRDQGYPVIAFGVIGPPEACIVTGYDEGGDVLIGWNFFQELPEQNPDGEFEPSGYFRKRDWFGNTAGAIFVVGKAERAPLGEIYGEALAWAVEVASTTQVHERKAGAAAYEAWAEDLLRDEDFPADDLAVLAERMMPHIDAMTMVGEGRWRAARFVRLAAEELPDVADELLAAAACYEAEAGLVQELGPLVGGFGYEEDKLRKLADPQVRRQMALIILQARGKDAEAADHLKRALKALAAG